MTVEQESRYRANHEGRQADQANRQTDRQTEGEQHADMAVIPSGNTFLPPLLSNVCMFAGETNLTE